MAGLTKKRNKGEIAQAVHHGEPGREHMMKNGIKGVRNHIDEHQQADDEKIRLAALRLKMAILKCKIGKGEHRQVHADKINVISDFGNVGLGRANDDDIAQNRRDQRKQQKAQRFIFGFAAAKSHHRTYRENHHEKNQCNQ